MFALIVTELSLSAWWCLRVFDCVCVNMVDMGKEEPPTLTG